MFDSTACEYKAKAGIIYLNFHTRGIVCVTEESSLLSKYSITPLLTYCFNEAQNTSYLSSLLITLDL